MKSFITIYVLLFLGIFCALPSLALATKVSDGYKNLKPSDTPAIDLNNRKAIELALLDYPELHLPWLREQLQILNPFESPKAWVGACWAIAYQGNAQDEELLKSHSEQCRALALKNKLYLEWAIISQAMARYERRVVKFEKFSVQMEDILEKIREFHDDTALVYFLAKYSNDILENKSEAKMPAYLLEANEMFDAGRIDSVLVYHEVKNAVDISFSYRRLINDALALEKEAILTMKSLGLRFATVLHSHNHAATLLSKDTPDTKMARIALNEAKEMAININDFMLRGTALYYLSFINQREGLFEESIKVGEEAVAVFAKAGEKFWLAQAKKNLGEILIEHGYYQKGLSTLEEALSDMPDEDKRFKNMIHWQIFLAYKGLKNQTKALTYLETYIGDYKQMVATREQDEYSRAAATLGLQVEQEKTKTLQQENLLQQQKLKEAERIRIFSIVLGLLSLSTISLLVLSLKQIKRIKDSRREIQMIFDNIDEGLLMVDGHQKIGADFSQHFLQLIGSSRPIANQDFVDTVFLKSQLPSEQKDMIREILGVTLGEEPLSWDLNSSHLPQEVSMGHQGELIYTIRWIPIYDDQNVLRKLLVSLTDITHSRALEKAIDAQEKRMKNLPETLREILKVKGEHSQQLLGLTEEALQNLEKGSSRTDILRAIHTQKGVARTLGLRLLSQDLHDLESFLKLHQDPKVDNDLTGQIAVTRARILEYRAFADILRQNQVESVSRRGWLADVIDPHLPAWEDQMLEAELPLKEMRVIDGVLHWPQEILSCAKELCLHAINNSLDHGFIFPKSKGKSVDRPVLEVFSEIRDNSIHIAVRDNGIGLDFEALERLAQSRGFRPQAHETVADVLFHDGVSTAEKVSLSSGRGVGLAAVKASVDKFGGTVKIQNNPLGRGTLGPTQIPLP